eukprot:GHVR01049590.1.p1 GENE.GHVR01049590.1~~GHVR01049590.1.p1  ORF type:complete len:202 (+),score=27.73 GHVR01049590.1:49-654(+)
MNINTDGSNTRFMQQHMMKKGPIKSSLTHAEVDLGACTDSVEYSQSAALNSNSAFGSLADILKANPDDKFLLSDVDQQLLLNVVFREPVTLTHILFRFNSGPRQGVESESEFVDSSGPKDVRIFSNNEQIDFQEAEDSQSPHRITLDENASTDGERHVLPGAKFHRLRSLQIFIAANQTNTPWTYLNRIGLIGHMTQTYHS